MYIMEECNKLIKISMIIRYIVTLILFYTIAININNKIINKYIYIILPILIIILDYVDNIFKIINNHNGVYNGCTKLFYYQYNDKICDSVTYLLLFLFFKLDNILLFFILYRIIGVILFIFTKNSKFLILFFDFAKEYLLYLFVFKPLKN